MSVLKLLRNPGAHLPLEVVDSLRGRIPTAAGTPTKSAAANSDAASALAYQGQQARLDSQQLAAAGAAVVTEIRVLMYTVECLLDVIHTHVRQQLVPQGGSGLPPHVGNNGYADPSSPFGGPGARATGRVGSQSIAPF